VCKCRPTGSLDQASAAELSALRPAQSRYVLDHGGASECEPAVKAARPKKKRSACCDDSESICYVYTYVNVYVYVNAYMYTCDDSESATSGAAIAGPRPLATASKVTDTPLSAPLTRG